MSDASVPPVEEEPILVDQVADGVMRITFNRPTKRNAMNQAARSGIVAALDACRDGKTKVVILTGTGSAFCSGVDLKEALARPSGWIPEDTIENRRTVWAGVQEEIRQHPAIVITAVNGLALGGGVTLINTSDLSIAADDAELGMPEVTFGAYPGLAGPSTQLRTSLKRAAWLVLTGKRISAAQAEEWGLVNQVVPAADLQDEAIALATHIAQFDATTLQFCKKALWEVPMHIDDYTNALQYGASVNTEIRHKNGVAQLSMPDTVKGK